MRLRDFVNQAPAELQPYFEEAAGSRNLAVVIMEKEFWVCWLLRLLFSSEFAEHVVFKGGTSLSKVHHVIERFSEDIDLGLSPALLGVEKPASLQGLSINQANRWRERAAAACADRVENQLGPALERAVSPLLRPRAAPWFRYEVDAGSDSPLLLFDYPAIARSGYHYVPAVVKLEFGCTTLADDCPTEAHGITPWVFEALPNVIDEGEWSCEVVALAVERSFWEKATILHAQYYAPDERPLNEGSSRHYADTAAMVQCGAAAAALARPDLREQVVRWKDRLFHRARDHYELAAPGTFRVVPKDARLPELRRDYAAMRDMYFGEPLSFDDVLRILGQLEQRINGEAG